MFLYVSNTLAQTFPTAWGFYVPVSIVNGSINNTVKVDVNFGALLTSMGVSGGTLDKLSIRVVRPNGALATIQEFNESIYAGATNTNINLGEVRWILEDNGNTIYKIYFDIIQNGVKPANTQIPINGNFEHGVTGQSQPLGWSAPVKDKNSYDAQIRPSENPIINDNKSGGNRITDGTPKTGNFSYLIGDRTTDGISDSIPSPSVTINKTIVVPNSNIGNLVFKYRLEGWDSADYTSGGDDFFITNIININTQEIVGPNLNNYSINPFSPNYGKNKFRVFRKAGQGKSARQGRSGYGQYNGWDYTGDNSQLAQDGNPLMNIVKGEEKWFTINYPLSAYAGKTIKLSFEMYHQKDYKTWVHLDDIEWSVISGTLGTPVQQGNSINHYELEFNPDNISGLTCMPQKLQIRACSNSTSPCTNVTDQNSNPTNISLTTNIGNFISSNSATNNLSFTGNTTDNLSVLIPSTANISINGAIPLKCYSGSTLLVNCQSNFSDSGIFFNWQTNQQVGSDGVVTAGNTSSVIKLSALKSDKTNSCVGFQPTNGTVNLSLSYSDPSTGTKTLNITPTNNLGVATNVATNIGNSVSGVNFNWDANGNTYLTMKYFDSGKIKLNASIIAGQNYPSLATTTNLISKPYVLKAYSSNNDVVCLDGNVFSGNSNTKFCKSGESFSTKIRAFASDGITTLNNFGKESAASSLTMLGSLISGVNAGNLKNEVSGISNILTTGVNFTPVVQICSGQDCYYPINFSWDNVGEINLTPIITGDNYFGSGAIALKSYLPIGRFYPFGFKLNSSNIINRPQYNSTSVFNYMGESFDTTLNISAINKFGVITSNYNGSRFNPLLIANWNLKAISGSTNLNGRINLTSSVGSWSNGILNSSLSANLSRNINPDGPYLTTLGINLIDTDGVMINSIDCNLDTDLNSINDSVNIGTTNFYFGRMKIKGSTGSELIKMPIEVAVQKYINNGFVTNTEDSNTVINLINITKNNFTQNLQANEITLASPTTSIVLLNGKQTIVVNKPQGGDGLFNGSFDLGYDVNGTNQGYLAGNWGVANYNQNPFGKLIFSKQSTAKKIIFWGQNF